MRFGAIVLVLGVCAATASACGGDGPPPLEGGTELELPTHPALEDGPDAGVAGTVEFDEETGCVFLVSSGRRTAVVWPEDTRATRDPFRIVLADGREIREGDHVDGSGGYGTGYDGPAGCADAAAGVASLNWHEDIEIDD